MKVVLADIEEKPLFQAEKEMKKTGAKVFAKLTDVSKLSSVEELAKRTIDTFGGIHLLFNNAGVAAPNLSWESTLNDWKWVMGVNLWGVIHAVRIFVPIMLKQNTDCYIVNTSSLAGLIAGGGGSSIYSVTKHGVVALSEALQQDFKLVQAKIKVSVLCPGFVKTRIIDCERNRPAELFNDPKDLIPHPEFEPATKMIHDMFEQGITPEKAADIVFEGIRNERFYLLTDQHYIWKKAVKSRMEGILKAF